MIIKVCNKPIFEQIAIDKVQLPRVISKETKQLLQLYSSQFTDQQKTSIDVFIRYLIDSGLVHKINKLYMPILCQNLGEIQINVADFIKSGKTEPDVFSGIWSDEVYKFTNGGLYTTQSLSQKYTSTYVKGMSNVKMNNLSLLVADSTSYHASNGTRLPTTKCFFVRNYSTGNNALQGTASGTTGTYCGVELNKLYPTVPAGYAGQKNASPCIDIMSFSDSTFRCTRSTDNVMSVEEFPLDTQYASTIDVNSQDSFNFSYMIPSLQSTAGDDQCVNYVLMIGDSLTSEEMMQVSTELQTLINMWFK